MKPEMNTLRIKISQNGQTVEREPVEVKAQLQFDEYSGPELVVLGVPFGGPVMGRDVEGEAFTSKTDIWMQVGDTRPVTYLHGYGPDSPDEWQEKPVIIGTAKYTGVDDRGHWFRVRLDTGDPLSQRIIEAMTVNMPVRASSGAVGHLVRMEKLRAGLIEVWPVGELAIFDTNEWRLPANDFAVVTAKTELQEAEAEASNGADVEDKESGLIKNIILKEVIRKSCLKKTKHSTLR